MASSYSNGTAKINDVASGSLLAEMKGTGAYLWSVAFAEDGSMLIGCISGGNVAFWDIRSPAKQFAVRNASEEKKPTEEKK